MAMGRIIFSTFHPTSNAVFILSTKKLAYLKYARSNILTVTPVIITNFLFVFFELVDSSVPTE